MDNIIAIVFFVIFIAANAFEGFARKKYQQPPRNHEGDTNFDIPNLANDPNFPNEEPQIWVENTVKTEEVRPVNITEFYRQKRIETPRVHETKKLPNVESKDFNFNLTPASAVNAIILAEILDKPKALRRKR